eukprot:6473194-Amphidinium_carterae.7
MIANMVWCEETHEVQQGKRMFHMLARRLELPNVGPWQHSLLHYPNGEQVNRPAVMQPLLLSFVCPQCLHTGTNTGSQLLQYALPRQTMPLNMWNKASKHKLVEGDARCFEVSLEQKLSCYRDQEFVPPPHRTVPKSHNQISVSYTHLTLPTILLV